MQFIHDNRQALGVGAGMIALAGMVWWFGLATAVVYVAAGIVAVVVLAASVLAVLHFLPGGR